MAVLWAGSSQAQPAEADAPAVVAVEPTAVAVEPAVAQTPVVETKWYDKVKLEALVDAYYGYRLNADSAAIRAASELRAFDASNHSFTVAYAELALSIPAEPAGLRIDLGFGTVADATATDLAAAPSTALEVFKHIQQAYATVKLFKLLTLDVGKFVTSAGSEVIEAKDNWLYSRSMLFTWAIPFAHTGLRLGVPINDLFSVTLQVTNGWDSQLSSMSFKTFGATALLNLPSSSSIAVNFYAGPVSTPDIRLLFDVVITQNLGDKGAINLNADFGTESGKSWFGTAVMAKWMMRDNLRFAARLEYFADPDGVRTALVQTSGVGGPSFLSATLGAGIGFSGLADVEVRPEFRVDTALNATPFVAGTQSTQFTGQLAFLAWF